jgi:hypothetical protein
MWGQEDGGTLGGHELEQKRKSMKSSHSSTMRERVHKSQYFFDASREALGKIENSLYCTG